MNKSTLLFMWSYYYLTSMQFATFWPVSSMIRPLLIFILPQVTCGHHPLMGRKCSEPQRPHIPNQVFSLTHCSSNQYCSQKPNYGTANWYYAKPLLLIYGVPLILLTFFVHLYFAPRTPRAGVDLTGDTFCLFALSSWQLHTRRKKSAQDVMSLHCAFCCSHQPLMGVKDRDPDSTTMSC